MKEKKETIEDNFYYKYKITPVNYNKHSSLDLFNVFGKVEVHIKIIKLVPQENAFKYIDRIMAIIQETKVGEEK
jgi:hypothetical protein